MHSTRRTTTTTFLGSSGGIPPTKLDIPGSFGSLQRTNLLNSGRDENAPVVVAESAPANVIYVDCEYQLTAQPRPGFRRISALVAELEATPEGRAGMEAARRQVGMNLYAQAGSPIARARLARGWSQARLAEAVGTSQSHIARMETGRDNVTVATVAKLADALSVDRGELATELMPPRS
jgi:ribosome-binding protein aMBF1 (putative translation factor)